MGMRVEVRSTGQMLLWDGSDQYCLEGRGPRRYLLGVSDDATGEVLTPAHFTEEESTVGYLRALRNIFRGNGIPHTVYGEPQQPKPNDKDWRD